MTRRQNQAKIDFSALNTLSANTISYYSGCDDLASNMAAVGACALHLVAAASKRSKKLAFCSLFILWSGEQTINGYTFMLRTRMCRSLIPVPNSQ